MKRNGLIVVLALLTMASTTLAIVLLVTRNDSERAQRSPVRIDIRRPPPPIDIKSSPGGVAATSLRSQSTGAVAQPRSWSVTIDGTTYQWHGGAQTYQPSFRFRRSAVVIVDPDSNFGIFSGSAVDNTGGQLWCVTNSGVFRHIGGLAIHVWASRIPAASVSAGNGGRTLSASVGPGSRAVQLNEFHVISGLTSPKQILQGRADVEFTDTGLQGRIEVYGGGYIEPGNSFPVNLYRATFSS